MLIIKKMEARIHKNLTHIHKALVFSVDHLK